LRTSSDARVRTDLTRSGENSRELRPSLVGVGRYRVHAVAESPKEFIESHGAITKDLAGRVTRRRVQGMAFPRRKEIAKHFARIGIRDDPFLVQVIAQQRRDDDVKRPAPVQAIQGGAETSRQLLRTRLIGPRLRLDVAPMIVRS
jgi:hypothetical protein